MHPPPDLMLAAGGAEGHRQCTNRVRVLAFQGGAQLQGRSHSVIQHHTARVEPYNALCPLLDGLTHTLALGVSAVCRGDVAAPQGEMLERFASVEIGDQDLDK